VSVVAAIREMLAKGVPIEQALDIAEAFETPFERPPERSAHALRQERYRERKRHKASHVTSRVTPDPTVTRDVEVTPKASQSVTPVTALACVEDNSTTIEVTGFSESRVSLSDDRLVNGVPPRDGFERPSSARKAATLKLIGETWNTLAGECGMPAIQDIKPGDTREKHALARASDLVADFGDLTKGLAEIANKIRGSPYLRGEVNGFRCSFDWAMTRANYVKIREGNYAVRPAPTKIHHWQQRK
jgi:hypothetical protein